MTIELQSDRLNDFDASEREKVLSALQESAPAEAMTPPHVNMHCHTFFSYNGYDASPSRIAYEAWQKGWRAAAICDFDVLDGLHEFYDAADRLGVAASVHMETRVFFAEYAQHEINSPGEPGIYYFMGAGFHKLPAEGSRAAAALTDLRRRAQERNLGVLERVNAHLAPVALEYERDVLPLTPAGNPTERHMVAAYHELAKTTFGEGEALHQFWHEKLGVPQSDIAERLTNPMGFTDLLRSKLMKAGGPGYVKPGVDTFPALDDVIAMILECEAIPMATWLDGLSSGEADMDAQLRLLKDKGVAALNIIPDRNWDIADPEQQRVKIAKLHECVAAADALHLPINVGTELNKFGQKWVDDFTAAPMRAVADSFIAGADIMVGHARLARFADFSYTGTGPEAEFGSDVVAKNAFFRSVGQLPAPSAGTLAQLKTRSAEQNYATLHDAAARGEW